MKTCSCCNTGKPESEFQVRKASHDGLTASCKACLKVRDRARYPKEREKRSAMMRAYVATEEGRAVATASKIRWRNKNLIKRAAHVILGNKLRDGSIAKADRCECCGEPHDRLHGHHDDYAQPLSVRWLCPQCHKDWHAANGEGKNAT